METKVPFEELVKTASEQMLFQLIEYMGGFIWRMQHDYADGRIPESDWKEISEDVDKFRTDSKLAADQLTRFGVTPHETDGTLTKDYWQWYRWWKDYFSALSNEQFSQFSASLESGEGLENWRPEGNWRSS